VQNYNIPLKDTNQQFQQIISHCREIFSKKNQDYGPSWAIFRLPSITDQIYIKANRIRTIEEKKESKVGESVEDSYLAIINYCIMALIQYDRYTLNQDIPNDAANLLKLYDQKVNMAYEVLQSKNHDYGEVWRSMRVTSITDLILVKIERIKQMEDNAGKSEISEDVDGNYIDILNYAVFSLILLKFV
jgi:hypothetical protein